MHTYNVRFTAYGMTKTWPIQAADADGALKMFKDWAKINKIRYSSAEVL